MKNNIKLKATLVLFGLSQADFAKKLQLSQSATSKKINGKSEFTLSEIIKCIDIFGKETVDEIFLNI